MTASVKLQISLAGGGFVSGAQQAAFGQSLAMQITSSFQLTSIRFEIYEYPPGLTTPSGWTQDPATGIYYFAPSNVTTSPPVVTLPSIE
jgi:hypothetical protein